MVVAASPSFRRAARADEGVVKNSLVQRPKGFPDGAVFLDIDEVADAGSHLAFGFFDQHGGGYAFQGGSRSAGYGVDVSSYERVVSNCRNHLFHNHVFLSSNHFSNTNIRQISLICKYFLCFLVFFAFLEI